MKIPDAYFVGGLGQKIARPGQAVMPDASSAMRIGAAAERLGSVLVGAAADQIEEQGRNELVSAQERQQEAVRLQREQEQELKKTQELRDTNAAKRKFMEFETALAAHEQSIIDDPEILPEKYPEAIRNKAAELLPKVQEGLNERQWLGIEPHLGEYVKKASERMFVTGQKEINDQAWAEDLAAADALVNNPVKTAREKITLLRDENFFADSGRPLHEIEQEREKRINVVIDNDVKNQFNASGDSPQALKQLKTTLTARDDSGNFTYFPEMQQAKREDYIASVKAKAEHLETKLREEANRRKAEGRQNALELVTEFKDKVAKGWMPNSADDFQFVNAVRKASTLSPSLNRQFNEANTNMGSLAFRSELRKKDPLGTAAAERGVILPPLNFLDPTTLPQQFATRITIAKQLGVKAVFTGPEVDGYSDYLKSLDPRAQVAGVSTLFKTLGPQLGGATLDAAAEQTRVKDSSMATLFKLVASGKPDVAQLYASGRALVSGEKKDFIQEKVNKLKDPMNSEFDAALGTALLNMKDSRNAMKDAVAMAYIGAANQKNVPLDSINKDLFRDVVKQVVGNTTTTGRTYIGTGGSRKTTIMPAGMNEDSFLDAIKAIKPEDIAKMGGVTGMTDDEAAQYLKKVAWHELGSGYTFMKDGSVLYDKKGRPFIYRFE